MDRFPTIRSVSGLMIEGMSNERKAFVGAGTAAEQTWLCLIGL